MWEKVGKKLWKYRYFLLVANILASLWGVFPPQFYASVDEHNYIRSAYQLAAGEDLKSTADQSLGGFPNHNGGYVSKYNLGSSIILAAIQFGVVSYQGSLVANLLITLAGMLAIFLLMRNVLDGRHNWLILLVGLYPPVVYFSRTAFSEVSSMLLLTISALLAYKYFASIVGAVRDSNIDLVSKNDAPNHIWQQFVLGIGLGFSLGAMVLTRYNLALWAITLLVTGGIILVRKLWSHHELSVSKIAGMIAAGVIPVAIGTLPVFLLFLLINTNLYGCFFCSGYKLSGEESLQLALFPERIWQYLLYLTPVLLILPVFAKNWLKWPYMFTIYPLLFLYCIAGGILFGENIATNFIYGVRFFMPLIPMGLLLAVDATIRLLHGLFGTLQLQKNRKLAVPLTIGRVVIILLMAGAAAAVSLIHQDFTSTRHQQFQVVNSRIEHAYASKSELQKLYILGGDGDFIFVGEHLQSNFDKIAYIDITAKSLDELKTLVGSIESAGNDYFIVNFNEYSPSSTPSQQKLQQLRGYLDAD